MTDLPGEPDQPPGEVPALPPTSLGRASVLLASGTVVSRVLGFLKAIVLAAAIGQVGSTAGNAFAVANQLPNNIYALIAGGVLSAVLVPQIVRAGLHADGGQRFINKVVTLGASVFLVIAVLGTVAAPLLVALYSQSGNGDGRGFSPEGIALATAFAYWCLPQVLFYALYSLLGEVLNARGSFGPFTWAPVANNVIALGGLVAFVVLFGAAGENSSASVWDPARIALLAGSATLGVAAQALFLAVFWRRAGLGFRPDFRWKGVGLKRTGKAASWTFGMILVTQLAGIVQSRVASIAATDGASLLALQNAWLIFMLPHSVIAVSIATAYFTRMSGHASRKNLDGVRRDLSSSLRIIGLFITFASATLVVVAFPFARVFEDRFDNVTAMALVIIAFAIGLVPFSAVFVLQRAFYALEDTRTPFFIEAAKAGIFVACALACTLLPVEWIGVGIALSTTVACAVQTVITFVLLRRKVGPIGGGLLLRRHVQYLVAALVAAVLGAAILLLLGGLSPDGFAQGGRIVAAISIGIVAAVMGAVYVGLLVVMRVGEARSALESVTARFRRRG